MALKSEGFSVQILRSRKQRIKTFKEIDHTCYILHLNMSFPVELTIFAMAFPSDKRASLT